MRQIILITSKQRRRALKLGMDVEWQIALLTPHLRHLEEAHHLLRSRNRQKQPWEHVHSACTEGKELAILRVNSTRVRPLNARALLSKPTNAVRFKFCEPHDRFTYDSSIPYAGFFLIQNMLRLLLYENVVAAIVIRQSPALRASPRTKMLHSQLSRCPSDRVAHSHTEVMGRLRSRESL